MKKLTPIVSGVLIAFASSASTSEFDTMHKQLDIMSKIITSSVTVQNGRKSSKINGVESTYLKGQGVVFTINSSSHSNQWGNYNFNFVMPDVPPVAPLPPSAEVAHSVMVEMSNDEEFQENINEQVSNAMELAAESYERAMDSLNHDRERSRDLRDEQRDLAYQVRDLEREKRDLEYQMRRADKSSKSELTAQMTKLDAMKKEIKKERVKLSQKSIALSKKQKEKQLAQEQDRNNYYQELTASLVDTFCLYGNGLRSVPKNENVSLIIKSAGEKEARRYKDKIYVFSKKDISDCAADKINVAKLLEKGKGYQF
jgi:hypothetical protein